MDYKEIEIKNKKLIDLAIEHMITIDDNEHNINHMNDVVLYTKELLNMIDVNSEVCIISAYWHDVGRTKVTIGHEKISSEMLKEAMIKLNYEEDFINNCCLAIENHKWNMTPTTIEGLLVKDADKLAWIGQGRWKYCLQKKQKLDDIIKLLQKLKNEILHFEESKMLYDRDIVRLIEILYLELFKKYY